MVSREDDKSETIENVELNIDKNSILSLEKNNNHPNKIREYITNAAKIFPLKFPKTLIKYKSIGKTLYRTKSKPL